MSKKTVLILVLVLVPVAAMVIAAALAWQAPSAHYVIAFAIGATLTVLLAVGLFSLSFLSSRRGFDEGVENQQDSDEP
jgi:NhaP-type Na+/H+ or K+/H+ antiporter